MKWRTLILGKIALSAIAISAAPLPLGPLANESYWSDGKAEFDLYDAQLMRAGELRHGELMLIFFREKIDPQTFARVDDLHREDLLWVIRMSEIWSAPIGLFTEQGSIAGYWRMDGTLVRLSYVGTDSFGNISRKIETKDGVTVFTSDTYRDGIITSLITLPADAVFYEELPMHVRALDFSKAETAIQLASPLTTSKTIEFKPAKIICQHAERQIVITVQRAGGTDRFVLDPDFPFLLREWEMAAGSKLKMKRDLKADYWNYRKNGDRERALNNPMLRHPD
ncbi:MAG: hypothetical protein M3R59_02920 [Verrucomicrobiota bacterium]|nr:hypothetical protein [Verrucomicrobiota bacterium]